MTTGWAGPVWGEPSSANQLPVPLRALAAAPDAAYRAEGGASGHFRVMAASVAGVSHRLAGKRCEDAYGWANPAPDRLALVVADGVSTAGRGGEGADLAVRAALRALSRDGEGWGEMAGLAAIRAADEEVTAAGGDAAAELSTTLVVALVEVSPGGCVVSVSRVGDSTAFTMGADGQWEEVFGPAGFSVPGDGGEGLKSTLVSVLPLASRMGAASSRAHRGGVPAGVDTSVARLEPGGAFVLQSDGVADPLRDGPNTVAPALAELLWRAGRGEVTPLELAQAADFSRRGAHDDRTLLAAWLV
ncbi:MAG TPA: protein phosphatase 2C domain-containing protein [Acidimicrobiales bacterium]|nr:protein phosphatase 2C domain-containing protein [Acidimicrobiales bacterium]